MQVLLRTSVLWQEEGHPMKTLEQHRPPAAAHSCPGVWRVLQRRSGRVTPAIRSSNTDVAAQGTQPGTTRCQASLYLPRTVLNRQTILLKANHAQGHKGPRAVQHSPSDADIRYLSCHSVGMFLRSLLQDTVSSNDML